MEQNRLLVEVNDWIRKLAGGHTATQTWEFICECPEMTCRSSVSLTLTEFDERRAASPPVPVRGEEHEAVRPPR